MNVRHPVPPTEHYLGLPILERFGSVVLLALMAEASGEETTKDIKENNSPSLNIFRSMLMARFDESYTGSVQSDMEKHQLDHEQQEFMWKWIRKEINLVEWRED